MLSINALLIILMILLFVMIVLFAMIGNTLDKIHDVLIQIRARLK